MVSATVSGSFLAYVADAPTGLEGVIGVRVLDPQDNEIIARSTANILEVLPGSGAYRWICSAAPATAGTYAIVWDTNSSSPDYAVEELQVSAPVVIPPVVLPTFPAPDVNGFGQAQDQKRVLLGSDVTFLAAAVNTWPGGTAINPDSGEPFDPTIVPVSVTQQEDVVRCGVFFKAVNRGGAAGAALGSPGGWEERTRIFAIAPYTARAIVIAAVEFIFHDERYKIDVVKDDEIITGYRRMLVYAAATAT